MQVSVEKTGDLGRKLVVELPSDSIDGQISGRLNELRRSVRLKGFRPGKVPMNVVKQRYGQQVREEVLQQVMQSSLQDAIRQQELRVAGVSSIQPGEDAEATFRFTAEVEVFPELPEIEVSGLAIERPVVEIEDTDVDDMIQTLREQRREWKDAERASESGDRVKIEFHAEVDGERIPESGTRQVQPVIGGGALFEGFEEALTGVSVDEEKTVELAFPEDFRDETLAGRTADVTIKVLAIQTSDLPDADDEFAKSFGVDGGMEQMRTDVRRNLERELRQARTNRLKKVVTDGLAEEYKDFALPETAIRQELGQMRAQLKQQYGQDVPVPDEQLRPGAERRVRLGFLLAEIARQHSLDIDDARVEQHINDIADTYENPAQVVELYSSNPQLTDQVRNLVLEEQVVEWVLDNAKVADKSMSFKELMES
jgi:trigger factor